MQHRGVSENGCQKTRAETDFLQAGLCSAAMTLFIACLLIWKFDLDWWWYGAAALIWIVPYVFALFADA